MKLRHDRIASVHLLVLIIAALLMAGCGPDKYELWGQYAKTEHQILDGSREAAVLEANATAFFALKALGEIVEVSWNRHEAPSCERLIKNAHMEQFEYSIRLVGGARPTPSQGGGYGHFNAYDAGIIVRHIDFIREHPVSLSVRMSQDNPGIGLEITLANNLGDPIVVDRELRVGLDLVVSGNDPAAPAEQVRALDFISLPGGLRSGSQDLIRSRFISVAAGESVTRTILFADGIARYHPHVGADSSRPGSPHPASESIDVLPRCLIRTIAIVYDTTSSDLLAGCAAFTGLSADELMLAKIQLRQQVAVTRSFLYEPPIRDQRPAPRLAP